MITRFPTFKSTQYNNITNISSYVSNFHLFLSSRVVEWLDEFHPGSFRQAQVSFSTRIPTAFPIGDSMSMSTTVSLYNTTPLLKHLVKEVLHKDGCDRNLTSVKEEDENAPKPDVRLFDIIWLVHYSSVKMFSLYSKLKPFLYLCSHGNTVFRIYFFDILSLLTGNKMSLFNTHCFTGCTNIHIRKVYL